MTDFATPVGRLVQGKMAPQQRKDMTTNQLQWLDAAKTVPDMGLFFSVAFPKVLPNGQPNTEFAAFWELMGREAIAAWPQFFNNGVCSNPKFSWKYQDGDGNDTNGKTVSDKPGFKGHHILKFDTNYGVKCFYEGKFSPVEEIGVQPNSPKPEQVIKRGYYIRVVGELRSNKADLSKQQVPGIVLYPSLVSFVGGRPEDEISSGPDAQAAFGKATLGYVPTGLSTVPGAPVGGLPALGGASTLALPSSPSLALPVVPTYTVTPAALAAMPGATVDTLKGMGHTIEQLLAAGYVVQAAAPAPTPSLPALGSGGGLPALGGAPSLPALGGLGLPPAGPTYMLTPAALAAAPGVTIESLLAQSWTYDALVSRGYAVRVS